MPQRRGKRMVNLEQVLKSYEFRWFVRVPHVSRPLRDVGFHLSIPLRIQALENPAPSQRIKPCHPELGIEFTMDATRLSIRSCSHQSFMRGVEFTAGFTF
jgi:hypothetical protein